MEDGQINNNAVPIHPLEGAEETGLGGSAHTQAASDEGRDTPDATAYGTVYGGTASAEMQAEIAKVMQPKLVRHLIEQRRDEALFEAKRLQNMLDQAPAALLDCTQVMAQNIFG